jgi:hypothetical protein
LEEIGNRDLASALSDAEARLRGELPVLDRLDEQTRRSLVAAEFLHDQAEETFRLADLARTAGFSYAFAVEHEVKTRLGPKIRRFAEDAGTPKVIARLLESGGGRLSIFFERDLLRSLRTVRCEATAENYFHTFQRMLELGPRYRPDGLKAVGIVVISFGRFHSFTKMGEAVEIYNPLRLSGLTDSEAVLRFGADLINLQHARNPYIHPELGEPPTRDQIREQSLSLLARMKDL